MKLWTSIASCAFLVSAGLLGAPTSGHAGSITPTVTIGVQVTKSGAGFDWDYTVQITNPGAGTPINIIEIPEVKSGYLDSTVFTLPNGWTATEETSPPFADPLIKPSTTPAAWLVLSTDINTDAINWDQQNNPLDFNLYSTVGGSVQASVSTAYSYLQEGTPVYVYSVTIDPITPTSAPEPSTWALMGLGALGLIALRRRKGALAPARLN